MERLDGDACLNIAKILPSSKVNGPGIRVVAWVQGCTQHCPGCFNSTLWDHEPSNLVDADEFAMLIETMAISYGCEGITMTGGEPFEQAEALSCLIRKVKEDGDLSIVIFTGYELGELESSGNAAIKFILENIDLLIAGRYNQDNKSIRTWNSNADKTFHFLSDRYDSSILDQDSASIEINFSKDAGALVYTGFPDAFDIQAFSDILQESGLQLREAIPSKKK